MEEEPDGKQRLTRSHSRPVGGKSRCKTRKRLDRRRHLGELPHRLTACMPVSREFIPNGSISMTMSSLHWPPHRQSKPPLALGHRRLLDETRCERQTNCELRFSPHPLPLLGLSRRRVTISNPRSSVAPRRLGCVSASRGGRLCLGVQSGGGDERSAAFQTGHCMC